MNKLLLIEDEKILRDNTCELLKIYGFECITAQHGKEGLEKALSEKPDLIICDIMLPYLNGFQIKAALNEQKNGLELTPLIFLSAKIERDDQRHGMDLGASDYITKPFKITELVNSVNRRLGLSKIIKNSIETKVINSLNDFIKVAKHECNTPLNSIISLTGLIKENHENESDFLIKAHHAINTSGKRLYKTLNNLIDLVRIKNKLVFDKQILTANEIKAVITKTIAERATFYNYKKPTDTILDFEYSIQILQEDFEIIIFEAIDNMFKFSTANGTSIKLAIISNGSNNEMILNIKNNILIPLTFDENDIGPFKQNNRAYYEQQGSGLGLYLIKLIVEKYSGTIKIGTIKFQTFCISVKLPVTGNLN